MPQHTDKERFISPAKDTRSSWRAWQELHTSARWISRMDYGRSTWPKSCNSIPAFTVGNLGFYEFTRMPFGLCNVPATFQHLMQNTLGEINLTYCIIYLDDVIVFRHTEEEHLEYLRVIFECFREFSLKLKPAKCSFFQKEIVYLVHHVSSEGIHPGEENVRAIAEFPMPETYTEVRAFCGLAGHYCCFIKNFVHVWCMHCMIYWVTRLRWDQWCLHPEAQEAVRLLKEKILSMHWYWCCLILISLSLLETDASKEGLGAVISQNQDDGCYHPVACLAAEPWHHLSRTTTVPNWNSWHWNGVSLSTSKNTWLMPHSQYVWTTINVHIHADNTKLGCNGTSLGWNALASYEFTLEYQKGSDNAAADTLSQVPVTTWQGYCTIVPGRSSDRHCWEGRSTRELTFASGTWSP